MKVIYNTCILLIARTYLAYQEPNGQQGEIAVPGNSGGSGLSGVNGTAIAPVQSSGNGMSGKSNGNGQSGMINGSTPDIANNQTVENGQTGASGTGQTNSQNGQSGSGVGTSGLSQTSTHTKNTMHSTGTAKSTSTAATTTAKSGAGSSFSVCMPVLISTQVISYIVYALV